MTPGANPPDNGDLVTPGFCQALDVWGRFVRNGGGPLRGGPMAAWWLFELYGTDVPTRPPTVAEQDALQMVLGLPPKPRGLTLQQNAALATARGYLADACPLVAQNAGRPPNAPFTLQEAADDLVGRSISGDVPTVPASVTAQAGRPAWSNYAVAPTGPLSDNYWDNAPGGTDISTVEMDLVNVRLDEG